MVDQTKGGALPKPGSRMMGQLRRLGAYKLLSKLMRRVLSRPRLSQGYLIRQPVEMHQEIPIPLQGLEIEEVHHQDAETLSELVQKYGVPMTMDRLRSRLQRGKRCFIACLDGKITSYVWFSTDVFRVDGLFNDEPVKPDEIYIYDAHTREKFRGQGIYPYLADVAIHRLANETGRSHVVYLIRPDNKASLRAHQKMGVRPTQRKGVLTLFGFRIPFQIRYPQRKR